MMLAESIGFHPSMIVSNSLSQAHASNRLGSGWLGDAADGEPTANWCAWERGASAVTFDQQLRYLEQID